MKVKADSQLSEQFCLNVLLTNREDLINQVFFYQQTGKFFHSFLTRVFLILNFHQILSTYLVSDLRITLLSAFASKI